MIDHELEFQNDLRNIEQIPIVNNLLKVICQTTGMGFAAIARVTKDRWIACSVRDEIAFGLKPGGELDIETTICHEIRQSNVAVVINHVDEDPEFRNHPTPLMYGFQSYISVPIITKDGKFFGTLCAIDPNPHDASGAIETFYLFADLISFHLHAIEQVNASRQTVLSEREVHRQVEENQQTIKKELEWKVKERTAQLEENNRVLENMNRELESFAFISSHDLQEPLRKIQLFSNLLTEGESDKLSGAGRNYLGKISKSSDRMRSLINDLLIYSQAKMDETRFEHIDLRAMIEQVKEDLADEIREKNVVIELNQLCDLTAVNFQFRQMIYNIISNSIRFSGSVEIPRIQLTAKIIQNQDEAIRGLQVDQEYFHLSIADNGIGFDQLYSDQIFDLFRRLNGKSDFDGTGVGLAIVKRIVENHKGIVTATGKINEGARFDIYLPTHIH